VAHSRDLTSAAPLRRHMEASRERCSSPQNRLQLPGIRRPSSLFAKRHGVCKHFRGCVAIVRAARRDAAAIAEVQALQCAWPLKLDAYLKRNSTPACGWRYTNCRLVPQCSPRGLERDHRSFPPHLAQDC